MPRDRTLAVALDLMEGALELLEQVGASDLAALQQYIVKATRASIDQVHSPFAETNGASGASENASGR